MQMTHWILLMRLPIKSITLSIAWLILAGSCGVGSKDEPIHETVVTVTEDGAGSKIIKKSTEYKLAIKPDQKLLKNQAVRDKYILLNLNIAGVFLPANKLISGEFLMISTNTGERLNLADYYADLQEPVEGKSMIAVVNKPLSDYSTVIVKMKDPQTPDTIRVSFTKEEIE